MSIIVPFFVALSAGFTPANAQRYVVDLLFARDSTSAYEIVVADQSGGEVPGAIAFAIPNGEELTITRVLKDNENIGVIVKDGKEYAVDGFTLF